jgi:hypothetical protein
MPNSSPLKLEDSLWVENPLAGMLNQPTSLTSPTAPFLAEKRPALKRIGDEWRMSDCGAEPGAPLIKAPPVWVKNFFGFAPTKLHALRSM